MQYAVQTTNLTKSFGDTVAVDHVDLAVPAGAFYGFLGPNGAGKSTTIKCLTGLLRQEQGTIRILGLDPRSDDLDIKRQTGVIPEDEALFERLTGAETLTLVARVHGLAGSVAQQRRSELLTLLGLDGAAGKLVVDYSHGMRKKLALAVALLPSPRLLFLDEPFEGIDPIASHQIKELLQRFVGRGGTVFLTSHILEIIERLADHVGIIDRGRLVVQGTIAEVTAGRTLEDAFITAVGAPPAAARTLEWLG
ncbi:MAG: ABC transporter ATP-binding protein [Acidobacteria bacterium]|jgi:ABC-2 type transport system ATP-binding protein|nr:ABC transporter ATP-binding protein [Acidobacteriota bacterium]